MEVKKNQAPRRPCRKPNCGKLTNNAYCEEHTKVVEVQKKEEIKKYDNTRGTANSRGYNYRWQQYVKQYKIEHPLCVMCEKERIVTLVYCVDHIIAVTGPDDKLFWEESNHQSLCKRHHSIKTVLEDGGMGHEKKERFL
jgi:5-methylcytosine-specific restriction protein A